MNSPPTLESSRCTNSFQQFRVGPELRLWPVYGHLWKPLAFMGPWCGKWQTPCTGCCKRLGLLILGSMCGLWGLKLDLTSNGEHFPFPPPAQTTSRQCKLGFLGLRDQGCPTIFPLKSTSIAGSVRSSERSNTTIQLQHGLREYALAWPRSHQRFSAKSLANTIC